MPNLTSLTVRHCFPVFFLFSINLINNQLNGNEENPDVYNIAGIMEALFIIIIIYLFILVTILPCIIQNLVAQVTLIPIHSLTFK